ncbi:hypothetical protein KEM55_003910 [Ascosphaera atra]|nr:hypothetical protein KEM55_003910 [Ascosphaera atra]
MKLERARKEREAIAEQLRLEAQRKAGLNGGDEALLEDTAHEKTMEESVRNILVDETAMQESVASELQEVASTLTSDGKTISSSKFTETPIQPADKSPLPELMPEEDIELHNEEHLQLSLEEAFFLVYGLGVLELYPEAGTAQSEALTATSLFGLFRRCSYYPSRDALLPYEPDDNFIVSYVIYHHFRSLGWVVRSGVKFGVDYILYNRGPVFSHAEFAVIVLPSYSHPYWSADPARRLYVEQRTNKTWSWLHCVNRVQAQVKKTLVLCYVEIPPPDAPDAAGDGVDIGEILRRYIVREMCIRRWVPNRTRD